MSRERDDIVVVFFKVYDFVIANNIGTLRYIGCELKMEELDNYITLVSIRDNYLNLTRNLMKYNLYT